MEKGYILSDGSYLQVLDASRFDPPEGATEVPLKPGSGYTWDGSQWNEPEPLTNQEKIARANKLRDMIIQDDPLLAALVAAVAAGLVAADRGVISGESPQQVTQRLVQYMETTLRERLGVTE